MDMLFQRAVFRLLAVFLLSAQGSGVLAFELLSEGAMGSVSAVSANSAEELVSVAGSSAAGLTDDGYEALPFEVEESLVGAQTDELTNDLEFSLTIEVDSWVENLRQREEDDANIEIGYVDVLPPSTFDDPGFVVPQTIVPQEVIEEVVFAPEEDEDDATVYQLGRIEQTVNIIEQRVDSVTYEVARYVERAATINANPFNDESSIGSGYISDLRSFSNVSISAIRD